MTTKFQTLCRKPRSIRLSSFDDMSNYVTEFKNTGIEVFWGILFHGFFTTYVKESKFIKNVHRKK